MRILRALLKPLSFLPALCLMYMIFSFSAQDGATSSQLSYKVSYTIVETGGKILGENWEPWQIDSIATRFHGAVRKLAHMTEYFALAVSVAFPLYVYGLRGIWLMLVAGFIWLMDDMGFSGSDFYWTSWILTLYAGLTMVSNVPFYSFKVMNIRKSVPFIAVILIVLVFVAISFDPPKVIFGLFVVYGISGYVVYLWYRIKGKPVSIVQTKVEPHDGEE